MTSMIDRADAVTRRRARMMPVLAVTLLAQQTMFVTWDGRAVTIAQTAAWTMMVLVVLFALVSGGGWFLPREVRELANDDVTRSNRDTALRRGFIAAVLTAVLVFTISPIEPITAQRAAHLIVTIGLSIALLVFGLEERKGLA